MSQKTKQSKMIAKSRNPERKQVKPYRPAKEVILQNVVMSDTIKEMPVLVHDITERLKVEVRLKTTKKRHVNMYVPEVNDVEQPTGKLVKLKADITPWGIFVFEPKEYEAMKAGEKVVDSGSEL